MDTLIKIQLEQLKGDFSFVKLPPKAPIPPWVAFNGPFVSLSFAHDELSVLAPSQQIPAGVSSEPGWVSFRLRAKMDFEAIGILRSILHPIAEAKIPVMAISTFDRDYIFVKRHQLRSARVALQKAGIEISSAE